MHRYKVKLTGSHMELKNHVPAITTLLEKPTKGEVILFGKLQYNVENIVHIADSDIELPILLVSYKPNQLDISWKSN